MWNNHITRAKLIPSEKVMKMNSVPLQTTPFMRHEIWLVAAMRRPSGMQIIAPGKVISDSDSKRSLLLSIPS